MARIRIIKPELTTDEKLARVSIPARYLFENLPCHADREGRLVDAPNLIAGLIFPYDKGVDTDALLQSLADNGQLERYEVNGEHYIQIVNFSKHQNPHPNETQSLIAASGSHQKSKPRRPKVVAARDNPENKNNPEKEKKAAVATPYSHVVEAYNQTCVQAGLPQCLKLSDKRQGFLNARISENPDFDWPVFFVRVSKSKFLCGENDRGWRADFEWLIRPENFLKVNEGKYDNHEGMKPKTQFERELDRSTDIGNREVERTRQMLRETFGDNMPFQEKVKP